jgi:hypothetical protein
VTPPKKKDLGVDGEVSGAPAARGSDFRFIDETQLSDQSKFSNLEESKASNNLVGINEGARCSSLKPTEK